VEHRRFTVHPFHLLSSPPQEEEPAAVAAAAAAAQRNLVTSAITRLGGKLRATAACGAGQRSAPQSPSGRGGTGGGGAGGPGGFGGEEAYEDAGSSEGEEEAAAPESDTAYDKPYVPSGTLDMSYWSRLHVPGQPNVFRVRGPGYLRDRVKQPAGNSVFWVASMDMVTHDKPIEHIARFLPSIRRSDAPFSFVVNLIVPGTPVLFIVFTFASDTHPDDLGPPPDPASKGHRWTPFDFILHRFLHASVAERSGILKIIPHIAEGSWLIQQSVGTVPVILGRKLRTVYHATRRYFEVDVDISAERSAAYVTSMVRGMTKSLVIDLTFALEGQAAHELPEVLLGAVRMSRR